MGQLVYVALLAWMSHPAMGSCEEDQESMFCSGSAFVPQLYCPDVDLDEWICTKKENVRCACQENLYRDKYKKCVRKEKCEKPSSAPLPAVPQEKPKPSAEPKPAIPEREHGIKMHGIFGKTLQFIQSQEKFQLVKISLQSWHKFECECLKSTRLADSLSGAERKMDCYTYVKLRNGRDRLAIRVADVDFDVSEKEGLVTITLKRAERLDAASNTDDPPFGLPKTYYVLGVADDCLLVGYGSHVSEKRLCMLWSPIAGEEVERTQCLQNSTSCMNMYDVWESEESDPCKALDDAKKGEEATKEQDASA